MTPQQAQQRFGFHPKTLARWADEGKITCNRSPGGHRRYLLSSLEAIQDPNMDVRQVVLYAR
ncbi:helix-turn-helix domain-containing protein [Moorena producens]|uniref:helix-turn-helix domain-containing protein n=1 Tax=Moorena producens TaxID=1155739 RepID=UPI003C77C0FD